MKKKAVLLLGAGGRDRIYSKDHIKELGELLDLKDCCDITTDRQAVKEALHEVEVILSGWGGVSMDKEMLDAAPKLGALFYGAGSVRGLVCDEFWERGIRLTSAWTAIAIQVSEYTVAMIVMAMKRAFQLRSILQREHKWSRTTPPGLWSTEIGIIGAGQIGSRVLNMLKAYDVTTYVYDPYLASGKAEKLGATPIELMEMFKRCDVVSLHAPNLPSTQNMVRAEHFRAMRQGSVFINTARGSIVNEKEMVEVLEEGNIFACLDVTDPEPPESDSPLYDLDNVVLTPHLAGCGETENKRQGQLILEEVKRYLNGEPPISPVTKDMLEWMA